MANFKQALAEGFVAAQKAEIARTEIQETLEKLKNDLLAASSGKLLVELGQFEEPEPERSPFVTPASYYANILGQTPPPKKNYNALTARNPESEQSPQHELALWKQAKAGYPCSLIWRKEEHQCEDQIALENTLAELLKDPNVGEKLYGLTRLK